MSSLGVLAAPHFEPLALPSLLLEPVSWTQALLSYPPLKALLPVPILAAITTVTDRLLPIFPVSRDQVRSLGQPNYTDLDAFERAFGLRPRPFDVAYLA